MAQDCHIADSGFKAGGEIYSQGVQERGAVEHILETI